MSHPLPNPIPVAEIGRLFDYDPVTGALLWKVRPSSKSPIKVGTQAGSIDRKGYLRIHVLGKRIGAHRLVWALHHGYFPTLQIDHINMVKNDNRIANLREASNAENQINSLRQKACRSPYKGVYERTGRAGRWGAFIGFQKKRVHLGYFPTPELALDARLAAEVRLFGQFSRAA